MSLSHSLPLVEELPASIDSVTAFTRLQTAAHCVFLDSALQHDKLGRYSFVAAAPAAFETIKNQDSVVPTTHGPLDRLWERLRAYPVKSVPGLPPLQGGAIGLLSYDLCRSIEKVPQSRHDEFRVPILAVGIYDVVLAFDHYEHRGWIISQGWPEVQPAARQRRAEDRLQFFRDLLSTQLPTQAHAKPGDTLLPESLAPQFAVNRLPGLTSNVSREGYLNAVRQAVEYIHAGDIFQVNLSQRLLYPAKDSAVRLYMRLRERNPATFAGYFDVGEHQIISASPERFISVRDRVVEARPIKGTRGRTSRPEADLYAADDLRQSEKDRAENVMIVDLMRNDLSRVCQADSLRIDQFCEIELYQFVQHLVSVVQGTLVPGLSPVDVLKATFPGGSVTGAPKVRSMEIIAELEPTARGAYCGSLGYIGFDGTMDWSILIRTITAGKGWWQLPVGGGIVAQSEPANEYEETWQKALGLLKALR